MSVASAEVKRRGARRLSLGRLAAAAPVIGIVFWIAMVYAIETASHPSPTLFSDELQWTQYARSIAHHGYASIRGQRVSFQSLYVYLIAPLWRLKDTASSYEAVRYLNIVLMTSAAFPAYLLSRRLVSKGAALAVAAASIAIPPMVYSLYVLTEVAAYPWAVLCSWLIVEALAVRSRGWIAGAVVASLVAPVVRGELIVIPAAFAIAAFALWWRSPGARRLRTPAWSRGDTIGLALLGFGAFTIGTRMLLHSNTEWQIATDMSTHIGLHVVWATGAFMIGVGVLPLVAGLAALVPRRGERLLPHDRAFIAVTVSLMALIALYTGIKGAYNEVTFANRIDERNLFYLAPLVFLAAAIALERRRIQIVPLLAAAAFAVFVIVKTPIQLAYPYFDAPGFSIATMTNRNFAWAPSTIDRALYITLAVSVLVALAARYGRGRAVRLLLVLVALVVVSWNLTGQVTAAKGSNETARTYLHGLPQPVNWIDRATGGGKVTYLGQAITSGGALRTNLLEFWNPSLSQVWTTDGSLLFPGPTFTPHLVKADGSLSNPPGTPFLLADSGINPVGRPIATRGELRLYPLSGPIRLRDSLEGVDEEGWMNTAAAYNRYATPGPGKVAVTLSRTSFCPDPSAAPPAPHLTVTVGTLQVFPRNGQLAPVLGQRWATRTVTVPNCAARTVTLPVQAAPWRVELSSDRTFKPSDYGEPDTRVLSVMAGFRFQEAKSR